MLNTQYYTNLTDRINGVNSCAALQQVSDEALKALADQQKVITDQIAALAPILQLLQPPGANLGAIVGWIKNLINGFLGPMVKPYYEYQIQLVELSAQITAVSSAISNAKLKFPNCSITPPVTVPPPVINPIPGLD